MKALALAEVRGFARPVTQQIHYTLEAREAEYELAQIAVAEGVGILVWSPLAGGLLSGKYGPDAPSARQVGGLDRAADPRRRPAVAHRRRC